MKNTEVWIFIFLLGLIGLNWPMLEVFYATSVFYLFGFWLLFIALMAIAVHNYSSGSATDRKRKTPAARSSPPR